jgi:hypothetical protein
LFFDDIRTTDAEASELRAYLADNDCALID